MLYITLFISHFNFLGQKFSVQNFKNLTSECSSKLLILKTKRKEVAEELEKERRKACDKKKRKKITDRTVEEQILIREQTRIRVRNHRRRQKILESKRYTIEIAIISHMRYSVLIFLNSVFYIHVQY